jgi:HlyD family secretion protein
LDIAAAEATIKEKELSLADLKIGTDPLDIRSQEIAVRQKENALFDAREKLSDYTVRAPFDGVVASIDIKRGDTVSSGSAVATLITRQRTAEISLNEIDVAKMSIGQKTTLTFDAVEGLNITGEVGEIDAIGTVTQGVVTYTVKIVFDTQDERIKPGMSVSAAIITTMRQDVLSVPNNAIKTNNDISYVEILSDAGSSTDGVQGVISSTPPRQQVVEIGVSNDISTEILSGLAEGDQIIIRTITTTTTSSTTQAPSIFGATGAQKSGTNSVRIPH